MAAPNLIETHINPALNGDSPYKRARITKPRWNPKEWHPIYEEIVLLDCMGYKRTEIAARYGFSDVHITNILKTDQAVIVRKLVLARINGKAMETIEQRLERVTVKAMQRVEDTINNDALFEKNPLGIFDRAITLLKGTKKIAGEGDTNINRAIVVSEQQFGRLIKGTEMADEARRLNAAVPVEATVGTIPTP